MAERADIQFTFNDYTPGGGPSLIIVDSPSVELNMQDLIDTVRAEEMKLDNLIYHALIDNSSTGKLDIGGGFKTDIQNVLKFTRVGFEARGGPSFVSCLLTGGTIAAVDLAGDAAEPIHTTAFVQPNYQSSRSGTLALSSADIALAVWGALTASFTGPGTFGEMVGKLLLTIKKFLSLKDG